MVSDWRSHGRGQQTAGGPAVGPSSAHHGTLGGLEAVGLSFHDARWVPPVESAAAVAWASFNLERRSRAVVISGALGSMLLNHRGMKSTPPTDSESPRKNGGGTISATWWTMLNFGASPDTRPALAK